MKNMEAKIYFQDGAIRNIKWLTLEIRDKDNKKLYRARRITDDMDITKKEFKFDFPDHCVDYTRRWKDNRREETQQINMEKFCHKEKWDEPEVT